MKWNQAIRRLVYKRLLDTVGPYSDWELKSCPKKGGSQEFEKLMGDISIGLSLLTGLECTADAVRIQINFAIEDQKSFERQDQMKVHYLNIVAALEVDFMTNKDLPSIMLKEK